MRLSGHRPAGHRLAGSGLVALAFAAYVLSGVTTDAATWKVGRERFDCFPFAQCDFHDSTTGGEEGGGIERAMVWPSTIPGDTVLVWPGTINSGDPPGYTQKIPMKSGVTLLAYGYPDSVVLIQGSAGGEAAITIVDGNELTTIEGFVIEWDAQSNGIGGGIAAFVSSGAIRNNIFRKCKAGIGAAVHLQLSDLTVENNLFLADTCLSGGGVVSISGGSPTVMNNTFVEAYAPFGTDGSAVFANGSSFILDRNIIAASSGAAAVFCGGTNTPLLQCNVFWQSELGPFAGTCVDSVGASGNVVADPLFCSPVMEDYGLCADSPALTGTCGTIGYVSPTGNCAPCEPPPPVSVNTANLEPVSWGVLKSRYRSR